METVERREFEQTCRLLAKNEVFSEDVIASYFAPNGQEVIRHAYVIDFFHSRGLPGLHPKVSRKHLDNNLVLRPGPIPLPLTRQPILRLTVYQLYIDQQNCRRHCVAWERISPWWGSPVSFALASGHTLDFRQIVIDAPIREPFDSLTLPYSIGVRISEEMERPLQGADIFSALCLS